MKFQNNTHQVDQITCIWNNQNNIHQVDKITCIGNIKIIHIKLIALCNIKLLAGELRKLSLKFDN